MLFYLLQEPGMSTVHKVDGQSCTTGPGRGGRGGEEGEGEEGEGEEGEGEEEEG